MRIISTFIFLVCLITSAQAFAFVYECHQHVGNDTIELSGNKSSLQLQSNLNKRIHGKYVRAKLPPQARVAEFSKVKSSPRSAIDVVTVTFEEESPAVVISGNAKWFFATFYLYNGTTEESLSYSCEPK
jgi:hypothetical protein